MDQSNRNLYINSLYLMSKIVLLKQEIDSNVTLETLQTECNNSRRSSGSKFSCQSDVNVWRQELETALFDFMLKQSYSEVYETLLKAIQVVDKIDFLMKWIVKNFFPFARLTVKSILWSNICSIVIRYWNRQSNCYKIHSFKTMKNSLRPVWLSFKHCHCIEATIWFREFLPLYKSMRSMDGISPNRN